MTSMNLDFEDNTVVIGLYGEHGCNLKLIEDALGVDIQTRGNKLTITGDADDIDLARRACLQLYGLVRQGYPLESKDVEFAIGILSEDPKAKIADIFLDNLTIKSGRKKISPKSLAQKYYVEAIRGNDIVFGIGPAGTGKTYLAMAMAISFLLNDDIARIIMVRPAVEAGERLGFLPGDLEEKVNPYLRPLYDALYDMLPFDRVARLLERGIIEVAPLAFMRGRTLNDAFVILDEAQNTTSSQMKMFLTRIGFGSKAVITGDITQIDLNDRSESGLVEAKRLLKDIKGIGFCTFSKKDVVRHPLVKRIIQAYEEEEEKKSRKFT